MFARSVKRFGRVDTLVANAGAWESRDVPLHKMSLRQWRQTQDSALTSAFLSGGLFGFDGIHPTDLGYALVANEWIRLINSRGGQLEAVNLGPYLGVGSAAARSASAPSRARAVVAGGRAPWTAFTAEVYDALRAAFPLSR